MPLCVSTSQHRCLVVIHAILNNLHERIAKHGTPVINHPSGSIRAYVKTNTFALVWRCVKLISGVCLWLTWHATPAKPALNPLYLTTQSTKSGTSGICHRWHFKAFKNSCFNRDRKILSRMFREHHLLSENVVVCAGTETYVGVTSLRERKIPWQQFLGGAFPWATISSLILTTQAWKQYLSPTSRLAVPTCCTPEMTSTTGISWVNVFWCSTMNGHKIIPQLSEAWKLLNFHAKCLLW